MELIYAALLLHSAKKEINEENLSKVISAAGISVDAAKIKALTAALEGVNIDEAIAKAAMPVAVSTAAAPAQGAEKKEEKKEEEKEKKVEEAAAGLGALFG
jgi:large subunit ribosomal protein L12